MGKAAAGLFPAHHASTFTVASLVPLRKKDGNPRPIAVGEVLRRLIAKCVLRTEEAIADLAHLVPHQLGLGIPDACGLIAQTL